MVISVPEAGVTVKLPEEGGAFTVSVISPNPNRETSPEF